MVRVFAFLALFVPLASLSAGDFADISYEDLVTAIEKGEVTVIDNNGTASYEKAHITGAIDFQSAKKLGSFESQLPENKDALIVAYCGGPGCPAWKSGAKASAKLGYTNVKHFSGGISEWVKKQKKTSK